MTESLKDNARRGAGDDVTQLAGQVTQVNEQKKFSTTSAKSGKQEKQKLRTVVCDESHLRAFCRRIAENGLALRSSASDTQTAMLPKVLQFMGESGLSSCEGRALGYMQIPTRIKELRETWDIDTVLENVIGPDGLFHCRIARYVLRGKKQPSQLNLETGAA